MDYDLKKKQLQNESPSDIKIRARGMDDDNPNRCIKASITPNLIINQQGCLAATAHIPAKKKWFWTLRVFIVLQTSWVIKCPHWTSPNQNRYMVNAMATFSGDVQYCQNGLPTPEHFLSFLVGGFNPSEKYEGQWEWLSHILWKNKKCSKPPTSFHLPRKIRWCSPLLFDTEAHFT